MKKTRLMHKVLFGCVLLIHICLTCLVVFLMRHVQDLLDLDTRINLTEVVTQNKDVITSRLMLSIKSLDVISNKITESMKSAGIVGDEEIHRFVAEYARKNNTPELFVADNTGAAFSRNLDAIDISGRKYFRLAIAGTANISDKTISRYDGKDIFVVSVPIFYQNVIVGTVQQVYGTEEMYNMCSSSLFSEQGFIHIINSAGYIILHSNHDTCWQVSDNYFRDLYISGNEGSSAKLAEDIQHKRAGFMETTQNGDRIFSAYTAIDKAHDWFLITSVPNNVVSPNANLVIKIFYGVLLVVTFIFTSSAVYFLWYERKQSDRIEKIAFVDTLTGGNTYAKFIIDVEKTLQDSSNIEWHIVKFDIDSFKYVNKFHGFDFGDHVLRNIVCTLTPQLHSGELLARMSGDHFVMLLQDASEERLRTLLSSVKTDDVLLYFSAGVYTVTDTQESLSLMTDKAATAAQTAKGMLDKQIIYYTEDFDRINTHNEQLKIAVVQAVECSEFIPYFQPKVDINTGHVVGGEALARWLTPEGKLMPPGQFIPMSEHTGIIVDIDMMIYEKTLQFLKKHLDEGCDCVPISVNFSRLHLLDEIFFDKVVAKLHQYGVPASLIELELTESAIFDNMSSISQFTERMHSHGLMIAMDDFGSGYSSLNMLKNVSIDTLKIDKAFLEGDADDIRRDIIFSTIVVMANKLNINIVVEGVEYVENVDLMRQCGCAVAQGYYFARPMPDAEFSTLMKRGYI